MQISDILHSLIPKWFFNESSDFWVFVKKSEKLILMSEISPNYVQYHIFNQIHKFYYLLKKHSYKT